MVKLCFIGAGSTVFTKHIITDLLLLDEFKDMDIALMDIDAERLNVSFEVISVIAKQLNHTGNIETYQDRKKALKGSDFVVTAIQVGGYKPATVIDFEIPKKYGLRQTIADTLGIGGIMRGLRTIPVLLDIAEDISQVCPNATWLQYVNPMVMNMMAIFKRYPELKVVGLCHSVQGTAEMLAKDLGEDMNDIVYECAGINHVAFYTKFAKKLDDGEEEDLYPRLREVAKEMLSDQRKSSRDLMDGNRYMAEKVRYEMLTRLGYFVTESSEHFSEYVSWFIKSHNEELLKQYEIPLDEYIDRCEYSINKWKNLKESILEQQVIPTEVSNEYASLIAQAIVSNKEAVFNGNVSNKGFLIPNFEEHACVEVPCKVNKNGIKPQKVERLPTQLAAIMQSNLSVQELTVAAVLEGRRRHVYHAAMMDPHTAAELSIEQIYAMVDEMMEAHGKFIPKKLRR